MSINLNVELSLDMAQRIESKANDYFRNAYQAALLTPEAMYVQGFVVYAIVDSWVIVEYSWIEIGDRIIDPSLPHLNKQSDQVYYFPAQRLSVQQLKAAVEEAQEDYPEDDPLPVYGTTPYEYYGDVMLGGIDYLAAYQTAEDKWQQLNRQSSRLLS